MLNYEHSILKKLEKKRQYAVAQEGVLGGFWRGVRFIEHQYDTSKALLKRSRQNWVYESSPEAKAGLEFLLEQGGGPSDTQPLHLLQLDPGRRHRL